MILLFTLSLCLGICASVALGMGEIIVNANEIFKRFKKPSIKKRKKNNHCQVDSDSAS